MKNLFLPLLLMLSTGLFAQVDTTTPPFKKFPTHPPIQILLGDSITKFTKADLSKKKPVLFMLFSPDCSHCQHTAEEMLGYKEQLSGIQVVMVTMQSISNMNAFVEKYRLKEIPDLVVGKDIYYVMPSYYDVKSLPYLAFYDKKGRLIRGFEGSMSMDQVLKQFKIK
jgi:thiol-disulfide isomerase/thioredoxin